MKIALIGAEFFLLTLFTALTSIQCSNVRIRAVPDGESDMNEPFEENAGPRMSHPTSLTAHEINDLSSSQIHYCVADLQLLQKGIKAYDYDNTEYKIMKKYVDENISLNGYSWDTVNSDLTRRITLGLTDDTTNNPDSLPYAAWDYGYSVLESHGVAPGTAAANTQLNVSIHRLQRSVFIT